MPTEGPVGKVTYFFGGRRNPQPSQNLELSHSRLGLSLWHQEFSKADINWQSGESVSRVGKAAGIAMYLRLPSPFLLSWGVGVGKWRVLVMRKRDSKHALSKCT